ncbi:MAG TPA: TlpA disulfide reductase family protein, partial [Rudaea sp.]
MKLLFATLLALAASSAFGATASKPTLSVKTLDGAAFDLSKQSGKWTIVNFWATWCSPCLKELPDISKYVQTHKDKVAAIGLAFEDSDKEDIIN